MDGAVKRSHYWGLKFIIKVKPLKSFKFQGFYHLTTTYKIHLMFALFYKFGLN